MKLAVFTIVVCLFVAPFDCLAQWNDDFGRFDFSYPPSNAASAWLAGDLDRASFEDNYFLNHEVERPTPTSELPRFFTGTTLQNNSDLSRIRLIRGQSPSPSQSGNANSGGGGGDLTSKANDPTAALVSFNVQNFFTTESYEASGHGYSLGLLPVIPIQQEILGFDYMITRPSIPIFGPSVDPLGPVSSESGLGDIFVTNLLIKKESWGAWGLGPSFNLPTATDPALGSREWQVAPSAALVVPKGKEWLFGGLLLAPFSLQSNLKSISFQPIVVRFLPNDWYVGNGFQVWNWQTNNGNFSMPLTLRIGRVLKEVKPYPLNISMQAGYTPEEWHQGPAARWQFLFNVTVLMPAG